MTETSFGALTYRVTECVTFRKVTPPWGGLSNMAGGFPLRVAGMPVRTSEALYQACRFPHRPELQRLILAQPSPMAAKVKGKPHRADSRPDWAAAKVPLMRWTLRVKLACHLDGFGRLLLASGDRPIVVWWDVRDANCGYRGRDDRLSLIDADALAACADEILRTSGVWQRRDRGRRTARARLRRLATRLLLAQDLGGRRGVERVVADAWHAELDPAVARLGRTPDGAGEAQAARRRLVARLEAEGLLARDVPGSPE